VNIAVDSVDWTETIFTGGVGVRYEITREYNLYMGLDVGFSERRSYALYGVWWRVVEAGNPKIAPVFHFEVFSSSLKRI